MNSIEHIQSNISFLRTLLGYLIIALILTQWPLSHSSPSTALALPELPINSKPDRSWKRFKTGNINTSATYSAISTKEHDCLANNIYFEGRNQGLLGQLAIAHVTLNRVHSKYYPNTICEVVWQVATDKRTKNLVAQFSWTLDKKSDNITNHKAREDIELLISGMFFEGVDTNITDATKGSTLYHADYVDPYWAKTSEVMAKIGSHIFYTPR